MMIADSKTLIPIDYDPFADDKKTSVIYSTEEQREIYTSIVIGGEPASLAYNESVSLKLRGNCNVELLKKAIHAVVARHEALRTTFNNDGSELIIHDEIKFEIPVIDITDLNENEKQHRINHFASREVELPFDLHDGHLFRFTIFKIKSNEHRLFIQRITSFATAGA